MFKQLQYRTGCLLLCLLVFFVFSSKELALATGLGIEPGQILIQNVPPGISYDIFENTGIKLKVINQDIVPHIYSIRSAKPSEIGTWLKGYLEIPDPSWF
ncbi:MAG: hypothetical protein MUO85_02540, partial [candidate division Zixibacteria bacterium]|nr:hypothetical protein [candidate division Zixibacteria bacterium]